MKRIIVSFMLLSFVVSNAQILQRSDNANDRTPDSTKLKSFEKIINSYDQAKLKALYDEFNNKYSLARAEAVAFALENNLPLKKYNADGSFDELQRMAPDGTLLYYSLHNVNAAISTRANYLNTGGGLGLTVDGNGMTAHVWDGGPIRPTHEAFDGPGGTNRATINDGVTTLNGNSFHSQHVTGTIMASGQPDASSKGMGWQANALTHDWNSDLSEATTAAGLGMLLSNHSYGYNASAIPDSWFGQYGSDGRDWDQLMYNSPYYLQINSAGNDGNDNTSNGIPLDGNSAYDKLNGDACAKNNLVIANGQDATINGDGSLGSVTRNSGSSEGPTDDYRIKPDIMGNGTSLRSTLETSNSAYGNLTGTSMSAPNVTGTLLLLQEHYNDLNASFMKAATLKGLALHTADDVSPTGPDAQTGWGQLNAKAAAETISAAPTSAIISELNLSNGGTYQVTIQSNGVDPLLVSISWTDPAGTVNNGTNSSTPALVNDLDLRLDNGTNFTPWRLTSITTNGNGDNNVDPYERIDIAGASGQYTLTVTHKGSLSSGSQDFSLIVTGGVIAASTPEISYGTITTSSTEGTDCTFTDVTVPLNIAMAPSQNADVTFSVNGGTAVEGIDYDIQTPMVTFLQGQTASQNLVVRFYNDGFVESAESAIIDFTVNANGGDATANPAADTLTITMNDDDSAPVASTDIVLHTNDFEAASGWTMIDGDGDGNVWLEYVTGVTYTGITGDFPGSETNLSILGGSGTANANNYYISPALVIPSDASNVEFNFGIGAFNSIEHYAVYWATNIFSAATINAGIQMEDRNALSNNGEFRTINRTDIDGQTGHFVVRHYNSSSNNGLLLFDNITVTVTVPTPVQTAVNNGTTNDTVDVPGGPGTMYNADSSSGDIMAAVTNNNNDDYQCVDVSVSRAGTGAQAYNGSSSPDFVMDKTFLLSPGSPQAAGSTEVTFYFTENEISGWETATTLNRSMLIAARGNASSVTELATLVIGAFGSNVTLTGNFTGLDGTFYFGPLGAFVPCAGSTKTWDGANWSTPGAPTITEPVVLNGDYDTATDGDLNACALLILSSGNTLTVNSGGLLNMDGTMLVAGSLIVEHTGSVVQTDPNAVVTKHPNTGIINVELTTPPLKKRDFMVMGSPMDTETRTGVFNNAFLVLQHTPANFIPHPGVPAGGTNFADDNNDFWNQLASGPINVGEGYIVRPQAGFNDPIYINPGDAFTFDMTYVLGTLNNGDVVRNVAYNVVGNPDGTPNVLANPYPSAISANLFITDGSNTLINEVYFWEHLTPPGSGIPGALNINFSMDDISMHNGTMGIPAANDPGTSTTPNGVISTGQGFGIKAFGTGTATFRNSMRLTTGNTTLRTPVGLEKLTLKVFNEEYKLGSYTGVAFSPNGTAGLDAKFDSNRLATFISLFSHLEDGSEQLGIQTRESFDSGIKIPVGFASQIEQQTNYEISIASMEGDNLSTTPIYLVDHYELVVHDLTQGDYVFSSEKGQFEGRFTIQFEYEVLGTDDAKLNNIGVYPNPTDNILNIVSPNAQITAVTVYDVQGRKVDDVAVNNESIYQLDMSKLDVSLYFITITTEYGAITKRIVKE